jgi:hypothetical protein
MEAKRKYGGIKSIENKEMNCSLISGRVGGGTY